MCGCLVCVNIWRLCEDVCPPCVRTRACWVSKCAHGMYALFSLCEDVCTEKLSYVYNALSVRTVWGRVFTSVCARYV